MKFFIILIAILTITSLPAQPAIQWQKTFGGNYFDEARGVLQTKDGGFIVTGSTASVDGDVSNNHGGNDYWVLKLDENGTLLWQKTFGGSNNERPYDIYETNDGGYLLAGFTKSNDGDVTGNHGNADYWLVKLSASGTLEWQKTFGGSNDDYAYSVLQTEDLGIVIAGYTTSTDGDVTTNQGYSDCWIIKLTAEGNIAWQKTFGGSGGDSATNIKATPDGGYIISGETSSADGDITLNHGNIDFWVFKIDSEGNLEWQRTLGGNGADYATDARPAMEGGYIVFGYAGSEDNEELTGHHGIFDYWIIKLSETGSLEWQRCLGGSGADWGRAITQLPDSSYVLFGATNSIDGDVIDHYEDPDFWLVKLSNTGEMIWQKVLGGSKAEHGFAMDQTTDGGFVLAGYAWSEDGDLAGSTIHGYNDFWVVKLAPESVAVKDLPTPEPLILYPNPASQFITLQIPDQAAALEVLIRDAAGRDVLRQSLPVAQVNISNLLPGMYQVMVQTAGKTLSGWFRKI
jgi:hypothetical protein